MYKIGLDIGTTSVGFSVLETDIKNEPFRIVELGSRIFDCAEVPKTGASLAAPRRMARGARRRNRRHKHRLERIKKLLVRNKLITNDELSKLYETTELKDIYEIRFQALDQKLTPKEFARLLIHLAQRRGFKSNRKVDSQDKENKDAGKLLKAVEENKKLMAEKKYRTVGEMFYLDEKFAQNKRNKAENYSNTIDRSQMADEIELIFKAQSTQANNFATEALKNDYLEIFTSQRKFEEGPGEESPYSGNQIEKMIGRCTFEADEPRAVKGAYTYEYSVLLQKINSLTLKTENGKKRKLNPEERMVLDALAHDVADLKYTRIRKSLGISENETFVGLSYGRKDIKDVEDKAKFNYLKHYHLMKKAFNTISKNAILNVPIDTRDNIAMILTLYKTDAAIKEQLELIRPSLAPLYVEAVLTLPSFKQVGNLSLKATKKILPFLKEGCLYNEACAQAGYEFRAHTSGNNKKTLPPLPPDCQEITSPVVKRSISQCIKVINAIVNKYGPPMSVNIELAREMSKNFEDRKEIEKEQKQNFEKNEDLNKRLKEDFNLLSPTNLDRIKLKLWEEQDGICLYSGEPIRIEHLYDIGYSEIDHIIPYSISFDDSYKNKVLVMASENQEKKNQLPLEYLKNKKRDDFIIRAKASIQDRRKLERLLKETLSEDERNDFKERSLTDTKHITKFMHGYINDHLMFDEKYEGKKKVTAVNGAVTAYMRKRWGLTKLRADGDLHHALDATVVACITDGNIQKVTRYSKKHELRYDAASDRSDFHEQFPLPWPDYREEIAIRLSENPAEQLERRNFRHYEGIDVSKIRAPFVSRYKQKKTTGSAHKDTVRSLKEIEGIQYTVSKVPLTSLSLKEGEIKDYYDPSSDRLLYELLRQRLQDNDGDAKKAFAEPVYKPTPKGGKAPVVKKVKLKEKMTLGVPVHNGNGIAANDSMIRVDIYHILNDGYYFVPIYVADLLKESLPNKACVANKTYEEWKEMASENFLFSLYPNDLVQITFKKPKDFTLVNENSTHDKKRKYDEIFAYYKSADIATGSIQIINHDNTYKLRGLGIKTLVSIEKYGVDVLGNIQKAGCEKRCD